MRVCVFTKVKGMVVVDSVRIWVKAEVTEEGITERVKSSGLSAVQLMEKTALGSMLYLLVSPSSTSSEEWRESMGGAVRSVVNTREPAVEGGTVTGKTLVTYICTLQSCAGYCLYVYCTYVCVRTYMSNDVTLQRLITTS